MLADHDLLSLTRNELADALKCLLKAEIMTTADFRASLGHTLVALNATVELLQQSNGNAPQP